MAESGALSEPATAIYFLRPRGPFRIGAHPHDLTQSRPFPSSDTIFGALTWAYQIRFGPAALATFLDRFIGGQPPAVWTSAMPALRESIEPLHVLIPLPVRRPGFRPEVQESRKILRQARYMHPDLLPWFRGEQDIEYLRLGDALLPSGLAQRLRTAMPSGHTAALWAEDPRLRVAIDRVSGASNLFVAASCTFAQFEPGTFEMGMAIGVITHNQATLVELDACFALLGETGIGGGRSTGCGRFEWSRVASPLPLSLEPSGPLLSLCWPRADEIGAGALDPGEGRGYRLVERMGWIASPEWSGYRSRPVTMLAEGSHVASQLRVPVGGLALVTPDPQNTARHPVYRYGYGCFLGQAA